MKAIKLNKKIKSYIIALIMAALLLCVCFLGACAQNVQNSSSDDSKIEYSGLPHNDNYKLEQMTILSRHDVRASICEPGSMVEKGTPHEWYKWDVPSGELTLNGGQNETFFGQYFRQYLEKEKMIPEHWVPKNDEVFFYANSLQRTVATAKSFSAAMIPVANVDVKYINEIGKNDDMFTVVPKNVTQSFLNQVDKEIDALGGDEGRPGINNQLQESIDTLDKILDFKNSEYAKENNLDHLPNDPIVMDIKEGKASSHTGTVMFNNTFADALAFQYLEEPDDVKAGFGSKLSYDDMKKVAKILTAYMKVTSGTYTLCVNGIHPLLQELYNDINNKNRKFTFLTGHDTTISAVITALKVKDFVLPNTFTDFAPIGGKLVFSKWTNASGQKYCTIHYVYQSTDQIRTHQDLNLENAPVAYPLELNGFEKNADGMYKLEDVEKAFQTCLSDYNKYK